MTRTYSRNNLVWQGDILKLNCRELARIVPDDNWPAMWRVQLPNGHPTDMLNRTRAKDAAMALALTMLNRKPEAQETPVAASQTSPQHQSQRAAARREREKSPA
jgi:hypothetical protein